MTVRTPDPVKDFLRSAVERRIEVKRHKRRLALLESQCTQIPAPPSAAPGGGGDTHGRESLWAALADAREEEARLIKAELEQYRTVELFIKYIPDTTHRTLLRLRYLEGMSWTKLQFALCDEGVYYSDRHLRRIHDAAVEEARKLWREPGPWQEALTEGGETWDAN